MKRIDFVLAVLSAEGGKFSPVQVQKMFFLLEKNLAPGTFKPSFRFQPYNYGPYACSVYQDLDGLAAEGFVEITSSSAYREFVVTQQGAEKGKIDFESLPKSAKDYILQVSRFVRSLTFPQLISAIYRAYPEMQVRSVFRG